MQKTFFFLTILTILTASVFSQEIRLTNADSIDGVIKAMTLEEKAKMVCGIQMIKDPKINGAAGASFAIPRLGIPEIDVADGPAGLRLGGITGGKIEYTTAFPIPVAMASTWDIQEIEEAGRVLGSEVRSHGIDILLGPALNIQRDPLGGRNFEYFTEDPFLNGQIAASMVKGIQSQGVGAALKHYAANNTETLRQSINEVISERTLKEIYLPGFETAVQESKPWAVMSAYPSINGEFASQNKYLLTDVLRKDWGFEGFVMSDWWGVKDSVSALKAGNNLIMPGGSAQQIIDAVHKGLLKESILNQNIKALLKVVIQTPSFKKEASFLPVLPADSKAFIRKIAADGMVLLKNKAQTLPLASGLRIGLFGKNAQNIIIGGGGSAAVHAAYTVQLKQGLLDAGFSILDTDSSGKDKLQENTSIQEMKQTAQKTDVGIFSLGRFSSEGTDKYTMNLHEYEINFMKSLAQTYHEENKKLIVLLNIGAPIEIASWEQYADAVLIIWQPGQEAGHAVADILSGKVCPSGKLTETFPVQYSDTPAYGNFPWGKDVNYAEGILVGYRYYDTKRIAPQYPFGFGLSYTNFTYGNIRLSSSVFDLDGQNSLSVSVEITNTGNVTGKETVQLYIHDEVSRLFRPEQELKGFSKVELTPGETKTLSFKLNFRSLGAYSENLKRWIVEPGRFQIRIGGSSREIKQEAEFLVKNERDSITKDTPWAEVKMTPGLGNFLNHYIDDQQIDNWHEFTVPEGKETLENVLKVELRALPEYAGQNKKIDTAIDRIIEELNKL